MGRDKDKKTGYKDSAINLSIQLDDKGELSGFTINRTDLIKSENEVITVYKVGDDEFYKRNSKSDALEEPISMGKQETLDFLEKFISGNRYYIKNISIKGVLNKNFDESSIEKGFLAVDGILTINKATSGIKNNQLFDKHPEKINITLDEKGEVLKFAYGTSRTEGPIKGSSLYEYKRTTEDKYERTEINVAVDSKDPGKGTYYETPLEEREIIDKDELLKRIREKTSSKKVEVITITDPREEETIRYYTKGDNLASGIKKAMEIAKESKNSLLVHFDNNKIIESFSITKYGADNKTSTSTYTRAEGNKFRKSGENSPDGDTSLNEHIDESKVFELLKSYNKDNVSSLTISTGDKDPKIYEGHRLNKGFRKLDRKLEEEEKFIEILNSRYDHSLNDTKEPTIQSLGNLKVPQDFITQLKNKEVKLG